MFPDPKNLSDEELLRYYELLDEDCPAITKAYADELAKRFAETLTD